MTTVNDIYEDTGKEWEIVEYKGEHYTQWEHDGYICLEDALERDEDNDYIAPYYVEKDNKFYFTGMYINV